MSSNLQVAMEVEISELQSEKDWLAAFPVVKAFRPKVELETYLVSRVEMQQCGYRLFGLWQDASVVAIAGIQIMPHLLRRRDLRVQDLATIPENRSSGFGAQLLAYIEKVAQMEDCSRVLLYSGIANERGHKFYDRMGYQRYGIEFCKELRPV